MTRLPSHPRWTIALTSVAFFMVALDALVVVTALPTVHRDLDASLASLQWTINAYTLAWAAAIGTAAALGDRYGRRRVFTVGLVLFAVASAGCAVAKSIDALIAARVVQGIAAGTIMPLSLTLLSTAFPAERRGAMLGIWGAVGGLAVAAGPLVGGAVTQGLSWPWIFWINVPIGLAAAGLVMLRLPESLGPAARLDLPGVALVSAAAICIVLGLVRAAEVGWTSVETIGTLGLGALLMVAFVGWELSAQQPALPMRLFRNVSFSAANATSFCMTGAQTAAGFLIAQHFQLALGHSPLDTGLLILPWTVTPLVVAPLAGALSDRVGRRLLLTLGMALQAAGFAWFALLDGFGVGYGQAILPLIVAGVGVSTVLPVAPAAVLGATPPQDAGKGSAVNSMLQRFGTAFGVALAAAVFAATGSLASPAAFEAGFRPALLAVAGLSSVGAISALAVRRPLVPVVSANARAAAASARAA